MWVELVRLEWAWLEWVLVELVRIVMLCLCLCPCHWIGMKRALVQAVERHYELLVEHLLALRDPGQELRQCREVRGWVEGQMAQLQVAQQRRVRC